MKKCIRKFLDVVKSVEATNKINLQITLVMNLIEGNRQVTVLMQHLQKQLYFWLLQIMFWNYQFNDSNTGARCWSIYMSWENIKNPWVINLRKTFVKYNWSMNLEIYSSYFSYTVLFYTFRQSSIFLQFSIMKRLTGNTFFVLAPNTPPNFRSSNQGCSLKKNVFKYFAIFEITCAGVSF